MRKLHVLLAGLLLFFSSSRAAAVPTPDIASFSFTVNTTNNFAVFTNTSVLGSEPGMRRASWSFGDGTVFSTGALDNTQYQYASQGTYNVCLRIYRFNSAGDSTLTSEVCHTLVISSDCSANFEYRDSIAYNPLRHIVRFNAIPHHNNNQPVTQVCWFFGDGRDTCINATAGTNNPNLLNVSHTYNQAGVYNACVVIKYLGGCIVEKCKLIQLQNLSSDSCKAEFERITTNSTITLDTRFKAFPWHNNNRKPVRICWTFGDGRDTCISYNSTYTGPYLVDHRYNSPGNYEVCVNILYQEGCQARKCHVVQVNQVFDSCRADFQKLAVSTTHPLNSSFVAIPWHNNSRKPKRICWTFGDGRDTCIQYDSTFMGIYGVNHTYASPGNYEVCVNILYYGGCEARKCKIIATNVIDSCKADFERININSTINPLVASFRALPWHNNNRKPVLICWTFGDGRDTCIQYSSTYTGPYTVTHIYPHAGNYEVCVRIVYQEGCDARKCRIISVNEAGCSVSIIELGTTISGLDRLFYAMTHSNPPRLVERICWTFGDGTDTCIIGTSAGAPDSTVRHHYPAPGVYRVCVRVVFQGGCVAEFCREVTIRTSTNLCGGYMTDSVVGPRTVRFKGFAIHRPNDPVISYRWTFGDGTSGIGQEINHTYVVGGQYRVCLVIVTQSGCETRICNTIHVAGSNQTGLTLSPNPALNNLHALFVSSHTETVTIKIFNSNGVMVRSYTRNAIAGINNWDFDVSLLAPGIYSFVIQSANQQAGTLFLKG